MAASFNAFASLFLGVLCAGVGGEMFLRGTVGLSRSLGISAAVVGATVAAFATSSPELAVSTGAAIAGEPHIALGDALGSNVVNVAFILGLALLMGPISCPRETVNRDLSAAVAAPLLVACLSWDGLLSRIDGGILLAAFFCWLAFAIRHALRTWEASGKGKDGIPSLVRTLALILVGIGFLIAASKLIVTGAESIAVRLGLPLFLIGSIIVAAGTSTPELVATLFARLRGHDAIGLGNILGSNVFNLSFILAVAAMIHPVPMRGSGVWLTLGWGLLVTAFCWPGRSGVLGRGRGIWLLLLYAGFVAANFVLSQGALEQPHS